MLYPLGSPHDASYTKVHMYLLYGIELALTSNPLASPEEASLVGCWPTVMCCPYCVVSALTHLRIQFKEFMAI